MGNGRRAIYDTFQTSIDTILAQYGSISVHSLYKCSRHSCHKTDKCLEPIKLELSAAAECVVYKTATDMAATNMAIVVTVGCNSVGGCIGQFSNGNCNSWNKQTE